MSGPRSFPLTVEVLVLGVGLLVTGYVAFLALQTILAWTTPLAVELMKDPSAATNVIITTLILGTIILPLVPVAAFIAWFIDWQRKQ